MLGLPGEGTNVCERAIFNHLALRQGKTDKCWTNSGNESWATDGAAHKHATYQVTVLK